MRSLVAATGLALSVVAHAAEPIACNISMEDARKKVPTLSHLDDESFVITVHRMHYSDIPFEYFQKLICKATGLPPKKPKELGWYGRWRYESCQKDAAKAATPQGVFAGLRICREEFEQ